MNDNARQYHRILVTGNAGVGKSTVAAMIAEELSLELFGLDAIVWQPGWKPTPAEERRLKIDEIVARPSWIVDGVSVRLWRAADLVIFLDYSRRVSLIRCARRNWRYLFRSRPGLPEGCPEILIIPTLLRIIWRFPTDVKPRLLADFMAPDDARRLIVVQNEDELDHLMASVRQHSLNGRPILAEG